jgi:hypothetical protein
MRSINFDSGGVLPWTDTHTRVRLKQPQEAVTDMTKKTPNTVQLDEGEIPIRYGKTADQLNRYERTPKGRLARVALFLLHGYSVLSGGNTKLLECRTFQTAQVAFAGSRSLKNVLRHFQRRDGLTGQESSIRDNFVQRLPQKGDGRCIKFPFQIIHRSRPKLLGAS